MTQAWDKEKDLHPPIGIPKHWATYETPGRRSIPWATRTHVEAGHLTELRTQPKFTNKLFQKIMLLHSQGKTFLIMSELVGVLRKWRIWGHLCMHLFEFKQNMISLVLIIFMESITNCTNVHSQKSDKKLRLQTSAMNRVQKNDYLAHSVTGSRVHPFNHWIGKAHVISILCVWKLILFQKLSLKRCLLCGINQILRF